MTRREAERRSREQLLALYEIGRAINSTLDLSALLDRILESTLGLFAAEAGSVMLLHEGNLVIAAARGLPEEIVSTTRVPLGEGIAGWVAQTGEMLRLDGKVDDPRFTGLVERTDRISSSLCTPLRHRGRITGVLMIRRGGDSLFTQDQLDFFASVADQAAIAIENARLYEAEIARVKQLELERQKLEAILASVADGVVVCGGDGAILRCNRSASAALGAEDAQGMSFDSVCPHLPFERLAEEVAGERGRFETDLRDGDRVHRLIATGLRHEGERPEGIVMLLHDETERARVERMKSEFLSMVSHELKTPLTTVQAFLELLLFKEFPPQKRQHYLRICQDESLRLQTLIEEILELSRLEAGQFAFNMVSCRLEDLVSSVLPGFAERSARHQFEFQLEGELPQLSLDPVLMTQAVSNLVSNAVKYSPEGGAIKTWLRADAGRVLLTVSDEGIGIGPDQLPYVFEKFFRVDNSLTRDTGGTGLGLANARYIVEGHGGSIWAESRPGRGSRFTIALPVP